MISQWGDDIRKPLGDGTLLHSAIYNPNVEVMKLLVSLGMDINTENVTRNFLNAEGAERRKARKE